MLFEYLPTNVSKKTIYCTWSTWKIFRPIISLVRCYLGADL